jgi:hypothetical protein
LPAGPSLQDSKHSNKPASGDLRDVPVAVNPLLTCHTQQELCATAGVAIDDEQQVQLGSELLQEGAAATAAAAGMEGSFWQQLTAGDAAFLAGRWQDCEAAYTEALPLAAGHLVSVSSCILETV